MNSAVMSVEEELASLEEGTLDPAQFPHREHVRFAYEMLGRHSFGEAAARFSNGLRRVAANAGHPEVYHETITLGFLALIAERRARTGTRSWAEFIAVNQELLEKKILRRWYSQEELESPLARTTFCLPAARNGA